jgi:hypothetical protein
MSILQNIPTPSFEFNAGLVDNRGALALVRQGQDITGQSAFPFVRNGVKNVPDKLGIIRAVSANEPAVTFDGQGRNLGYLPESARTNLLERTEEFDNAYWTKGRTTTTANTTIAPDGTMTAETLTDDTTASATHRLFRGSIPIVSGTSYSSSCFIKAGTSNRAEIRLTSNIETDIGIIGTVFDLSNGTIISGNGKIENYGNGWFRCTNIGISNTTGDGAYFMYLYNSVNERSYTGTATNNLFIWGAQLEEGSFASTYIKNVDTTAGVTRPADNLTYTNASDFIGQSEGVIYAEVDLRYFGTLFNLSKDDDSPAVRNGNRIALDYNVGNSLAYRIINNASTIVNRSTSIATGMSKIIITYALSGASFVVNGTVISADTVSAIPDMGRIYLGQGVFDSAQPQSPIRSVRLWKTADWCTDEVAQQLTTL